MVNTIYQEVTNMPECKKCKSQLVWKQPYKKGDLPINPDGKKHFCGSNLLQNLEVWKKKWKSEYRYKCPIWCHVCRRSYQSMEVCIHIKSDGFKEGVDTIEFYSDEYNQVKKREQLKKSIEKEQEDNPFDPRGQDTLT